MRAPVFLTGILLLSACGTDAAEDVYVDTLTAAEFDSLHIASVTDGSLMCTADGYSNCPLGSAYANRIDDGGFALWEPGRRVLARWEGDTAFTAVGALDTSANRYGFVGAVRGLSGNRIGIIEVGPRAVYSVLDRDGLLTERDTLVVPEGEVSIGFTNGHTVMQRIVKWTPERGGEFTVTILDRVTDTSGQLMLRMPIPWLQGTADSLEIPPLLAYLPSYAMIRDGGLVWSAGTSVMIERRDHRANPMWRVLGPMGPRITVEELDRREAELRESIPSEGGLTEGDLAIMRGKTDSLHQAVAALLPTPQGEVFAALMPNPTADSVTWLFIGRNGNTESKFKLGRRTRPLLATDDSILVHRPTEGEPWEVRWLRIGTIP